MGTGPLAGKSVLVVDDHDPTRNLLLSYLSGLGASCTPASGGREALAKLTAQRFDLGVLDLRMDDMDGLEVLKQAHPTGQVDSFLMMSAEGTIAHAVEAIRLGARDFLVKPFELEHFVSVVQRILGGQQDAGAGGVDPRLAWRDAHAPQMIGEHGTLREIFLVLERIAASDCTVLIFGESGTGKELVARALHDASRRSKREFVPVNCGAIPETLIESELFGHAKGAFSGATHNREGRFGVADGGTLFLDEIGEMALPVQVKFLRVLQEGEYVPVGETRPRKCDVRIVAATHRNLEAMVEAGDFREDLFYRLNLIPLHLPALRDRRTDIPLLVRHFLEVSARRLGRPAPGVSEEALDLLTRHDWPGNVRELENVIERMCLLHQGGGVLGTSDLPSKLRQLQRPAPRPEPRRDAVVLSLQARDAATDGDATDERPTSAPAEAAGHPSSVARAPESARAWTAPADFRLPDAGLDLRAAVEEFEASLIDQALARTGGNKNQASQLLGMNRTTLVEKLRKRRLTSDRGG